MFFIQRRLPAALALLIAAALSRPSQASDDLSTARETSRLAIGVEADALQDLVTLLTPIGSTPPNQSHRELAIIAGKPLWLGQRYERRSEHRRGTV